MASNMRALFFVCIAMAIAAVTAQDQCKGCINPTVTCTNAVKIGDNPPRYYLPCIAGELIPSLEQASGCTASLPNIPFTPSLSTVGGRKLASLPTGRALLQKKARDTCSTIISGPSAVCPTSHHGLNTDNTLSWAAIGLGQDSSNCPPYTVYITLAGSCDVGNKTARSRVTGCATTSITAPPAGGVIDAADFGCTATNDFAAAGVNAAQSWYFQDVVSGKAKLAWTPFLNGRSCQYKVAAYASNQCKALNDANTLTVTVGNGPLATGALSASCPKPYAV